MTACFDRAVRRVSRSDLEIRLGTSEGRLTFAGTALHDVFAPAFRHLVNAAVTPSPSPDALKVLLWDSASSRVQPPAPPWSSREFLARGEVNHDFGDGVRLSFRIDSGVLSVFVPGSNTALCWVRDPAQLPPWELAAPLRPILAWWAENTSRQLAHGAAVGTATGAVLLGARGGSGKSTTALSCLEGGMLYLGDDYVMLEEGNPPVVNSLYSTAKLIPRNLDGRLPRLRALVTGHRDVDQDKVTLSLYDAFAESLVPSLPLRAIVVPAVSPTGRLALRPAPAAAALAALAPTTLFQLPNAGAAALARMGQIVAAIPRYHLDLDTDLATNVAALRDLIERGARA